jgi:hypothetical protein
MSKNKNTRHILIFSFLACLVVLPLISAIEVSAQSLRIEGTWQILSKGEQVGSVRFSRTRNSYTATFSFNIGVVVGGDGHGEGESSAIYSGRKLHFGQMYRNFDLVREGNGFTGSLRLMKSSHSIKLKR